MRGDFVVFGNEFKEDLFVVWNIVERGHTAFCSKVFGFGGKIKWSLEGLNSS